MAALLRRTPSSSRLRRALLALGGLVLLLAAYLLLWPVPIDPAGWTPPTAPSLDEGPFARNTALAAVERISMGGKGPEDVAVDAQGRIYGGLVDGRIMRTSSAGKDPELFVDTKGRPLGLDFDAAGNLIVADAHRGLLRVAPDGALTVLATEHEGVRFGFTDDVDVAPDGVIYFSDASTRWDIGHVREDILEHRPYGRLLAYDPVAKKTRLVLGGLYFANGVAVSTDGRFVLVNETSKYRVQRVWLTGDRAGQSEVFIENLPGIPDGISAGPDSTFWLALYSPRIAMLDAMLPRPWLRKVAYRLPMFLQPAPKRHGIVLGLDAAGRVIANLQDPSDKSFSPITSAEVYGEWLYLGSLSYPGIARLPRPGLPAKALP